MPEPVEDSADGESPRPGLVVQPHGGALLRGGVKGNKSRSGRTTAVRALALKGLHEAVPRMVDLANGRSVLVELTQGGTMLVDPDAKAQIQAFKALADVALPTGIGNRELKERLTEQQRRLLAQLREEGIPAETQARIIQAVAGAWRD